MACVLPAMMDTSISSPTAVPSSSSSAMPDETLSPHLQALVQHYGLVERFDDVFGNPHCLQASSAIKVLQALGVLPEVLDEQALQKAVTQAQDTPFQRLLQPVMVFKASEQPLWIPFNLPTAIDLTKIKITLTLENGDVIPFGHPENAVDKGTHELSHGTSFTQWNWELPYRLPQGYHTLTLSLFGAETSQKLIATPDTCWEPNAVLEGKKLFGPALQLYSLKSEQNWGMGDYGDLQRMIRLLANQGVDIVGVNPLHELFPHQPQERSPYAPSSRLFFNSLYLDMQAIQEFQECSQVQTWWHLPETQARLQELRASELVDYIGVSGMKHYALRLMFHTFQTHHIAQETERAKAFKHFVLVGGKTLKRFATYQALQWQKCHEDFMQWGWPVWPEGLQMPDTPELKHFEMTQQEAIQYFLWLQFLNAEQLHATANTAKQAGMKVGLYLDLAVGSGISGADVWSDQALYATSVSVGCPPDAFNLLGQQWGLPAVNPITLRERAYQPFVQMVRQNMKYAGALRIDHFVAAHRIFWIPEGMSPKEGAFVLHDMEALMGILALESHRNQCIVIGEDLGTVPETVQTHMAKWGIYSYKVFFFEKQGEHDLTPPQAYPEQALVTISTHDLPTLFGFWSGADIAVRDEIALFPNASVREDFIKGREQDRYTMIHSLKREGLLPPEFSDNQYDHFPTAPDSLAIAAHKYLSLTPSKLQLFQMEDLLKQEAQMNMPGTVNEHPNWQRKLSASLEMLENSQHDGSQPLLWETLSAMRASRA